MRNSYPNVLKGFVLLLIISLSLNACKKDDKNENVNIGYVNITINPNSTEYLDLNIVTGWVYLSATLPSRGIIVYRASIDEFKAYERTPPYKPDGCCNGAICTRLLVDGLFVQDTCMDVDYLIIDGSWVSGPGKLHLVEYNTYYDGANLNISN